MQAEPPGFRAFVEAQRRDLLRSAWLLTGDWQRAEEKAQTSKALAHLRVVALDALIVEEV